MKRITSFLLAILMLITLVPVDSAYAMGGEKLDVVPLSDGQYMIKLPGVDYTGVRSNPNLPDINPTDNPDDFYTRDIKVDIHDLVIQATGVEKVTVRVTCRLANYSKEYTVNKDKFGKAFEAPVPIQKYVPTVFVKFDDGRDSRYIVEAKSKPTNTVNINIDFLGHTGVATRWHGNGNRPDVKANFVGINKTQHLFDLPKVDQNSVLRSGDNPWAWKGHDNIVNLQKVPEADVRVGEIGSANKIHLEIQDSLQGQLNGSKYFFQVTGDSLHGFTATMREKNTVNFEAGDGTWKTAKPAQQFAANGLKLSETFMDAPDTIGPVTVPNGESDLTPPAAEPDKPENVFKGWATTKGGPVVNMATYVVEGDTTFYAIYGPKDQGKVTIQYVDESGTAINEKYKIADQKYPAEVKGNVNENVDASKIPEPKFIGYERNGKIDVADKKYLKDGGHTVEVPYKKLDSIIPEDNASEDVKKTYTPVTFAADTSKGKLKLGATDGGAKKVYYVNPVEGKTIENVRAQYNITAEGNEGVYKVDETTPWKFAPDEVSSLGTVITTVPVTVNANFVKEKGTVTYAYEYKNETSITDPSKTDIPAVPTDDKEYEVETKVTAQTTVAKDKTVPVKDNSGNTIGNWKFSGWDPAELTVKKNTNTVKNEFKGTWTFEEAGKHGVTYKFTDESGNKLPAVSGELNKFPTEPTDTNTYYENQNIKLPTTPAADTKVKGTNGTDAKGKAIEGTWEFLGWYKENNKLTDATVKATNENKFVGKWKFTEADKGHLVYKFTSKDGDLPKEVTDLKPTDKKENYVGVVVKPDALSKTSVDGKKDNKEGTWKTEWTPEDVTLAKGENEVTIEWKFEPAKEGKVTYKFNIKEGVVPNEYSLDNAPFNNLKNDLEPKTAYVGRKVTAPKIDQTFKENITFKENDKNVEKQGNWTFEGWDVSSKDMVESGITFTGTWTWTQEQSKQPTVNPVKPGDKKITGKGEPESVIEVELPDGTKVPGKVDQNGDWTVDLPKDKDLKDKDVITVTQTEKGKTPSEKVPVTVEGDKPTPTPEPKPVPEVEIPGIKIRDHYTPTYPVYVSVPDNGTKVIDTLWYIFHIDKYDYEEVRNNNSTSHKMDVTPVIRNDRTMLPLRYVAEAIGADVKWDPETRTATFTKDGLIATIQIDSDEIVLSNGKTVKMDSKPLNINDRILVSVVNVGNVFGLTNGNTLDGVDQDIEWDHDTRTATIYIRR